MTYQTYRYLWPPRPETKAPPELIGFYERLGWVAQVKKNGTCTVIFARGDEVIFKTRHNDDHRAWEPLPEHVNIFGGRERWSVYVAELLHNKGPSLKHHLYLFDVLVSDGEELVGSTYQERQELLRHLFPGPVADICGSRAGLGARVITTHVSQAEPLERPADAWPTLGALDEGLVFKDPKGRLKPCIAQTANREWQVKIRRPHANYSF